MMLMELEFAFGTFVRRMAVEPPDDPHRSMPSDTAHAKSVKYRLTARLFLQFGAAEPAD